MTLSIRVIPCLDVDRGRVVKGVNFENLQDAGDPVELAALYSEQGADELTFLDVSATLESRDTTFELVRHTAENVFIPLTVGGGVRSVGDVGRLLESGADKISVNSAALARPELLDEIAGHFGSQVCVISVDAKRDASYPSGFVVTTHGGQKSAARDALAWAVEACERGAGELLLNSIDADGTKRVSMWRCCRRFDPWYLFHWLPREVLGRQRMALPLIVPVLMPCWLPPFSTTIKWVFRR